VPVLRRDISRKRTRGDGRSPSFHGTTHFKPLESLPLDGSRWGGNIVPWVILVRHELLNDR
jgi:hypothetical protein